QIGLLALGGIGPRLHAAEALEHRRAEVLARVAGLAARVHEGEEALLLIFRERVLVALEEGVPGSRSDQGALEGGHGLREVVEGDRGLVLRERLAEGLDVL